MKRARRGKKKGEKKPTLTIGAFSAGGNVLSSSVWTMGPEKRAKSRSRQTITDICLRLLEEPPGS